MFFNALTLKALKYSGEISLLQKEVRVIVTGGFRTFSGSFCFISISYPDWLLIVTNKEVFKAGDFSVEVPNSTQGRAQDSSGSAAQQ